MHDSLWVCSYCVVQCYFHLKHTFWSSFTKHTEVAKNNLDKCLLKKAYADYDKVFHNKTFLFIFVKNNLACDES